MVKRLFAAVVITAVFIFTAIPALAANDIQITVNNYLTSVTLIKQNANNGKTLAGATYELYTKNDEFVGRYTTAQNGKITIKGLVYGGYYFVEINPPNGYELSTERLCFTVDQTTADLEIVGKDVLILPPQPHTGEGAGVYIIAGLAGAAAVGAVLLAKLKIRKEQK